MKEVPIPDVYGAIVNEVPNAIVSHVCHCHEVAPSNMIQVGTPHDFAKCFGNSVPSFILVDCHEQSISLAIEMMRSRTVGVGAEVIVMLLLQPNTSDASVPDTVRAFSERGADDVVALPVGVVPLSLSISVSLAKATASRQQRTNLSMQLRASRKQCHRLFWEVAHQVIDKFPEVQTQLVEECDKRVGNLMLVHRVAEGKFGTVHIWSRADRHRGAVKVIPKSSIRSVDEVFQIATEFGVLRMLNHPNVVVAQEFVHGLKNLYIFMEMAGTRNLFQEIAFEGVKGLQWARIENFLSQVAAGLAHCHEMNVAHCDLKPENIVISSVGHAKIVDFGQAVDSAEGVAPLNGPRGTMPFLAPEVMRLSSDWIPAAADVWSLGVILFEMMCGNHEFVRLAGWQGENLMIASELPKRADQVSALFTQGETGTNTQMCEIITGLAGYSQPASAIQLLLHMLKPVAGTRILAESITQHIREI
jgi:serine/threonine protein kinase